MEIRRLGRDDQDALADVEPCFDEPVRSVAAARFLASDGHHLLVAYDGDAVVGFVSGVELTHPDKGTEMFLYELSVEPGHRGQGYGTALVQALANLARERNCYDMWVLTDDDNNTAVATYRRAGASETSPCVMLTWKLDEPGGPSE